MPNYAPLSKAGCVLVVVDIQEKLLPSIYECQKVLERSVKIVKGARLLGVPVVFTQQYTPGLGETHSDLRETGIRIFLVWRKPSSMLFWSRSLRGKSGI